MFLDYSLILLVVFVVVLIVILFLRRNSKDKKSLGKRLNASEVKPDKHDENESV